MPVSRLGQRRRVVIPKAICDTAGVRVGDSLEVSSRRGQIVLKAKKPAAPEETLTAAEEKLVRRGERQLKQGKYVLWDDLKKKLKL